MSWAELVTPGPATLRGSTVEQERFGLDVDRLVVPRGTDASNEEVCRLASSSDAQVTVVRYPAERVDLFAALLATGRPALLADTLVYWQLRVGTGRRPDRDAELAVWVEPLDRQAVEALVADIFAGYANHYAANPLFDARAALAGYQDWAARSLAATPPVVVARDGRPVALATVDLGASEVEVELAGVVTREQGRGVYGHLLGAVEDVAARERRDAVVISTQGHNTGVQRAWARYGFDPAATFLTVHLLREGLLGR